MNDASKARATRAVERASIAVRKHFEVATAAGMHPDEFWYWLGSYIEPERIMRPRNVSLANFGKKQRAAKGLRANKEKKFPRDERIRAMFEVTAEEGKPFKAIYKLIKKHCGVSERRARDICKHERKAFRAKSRG